MYKIFSIPTVLAQETGRVVTKATEPTTSSLSTFLFDVFKGLPQWIAGGVILVVALFLSKIVARIVTQAIIRKRGEDFKKGSIILIGRVVSISIFVFGLVIALQVIGLKDMGWLFGSIGIGIGFALKDLINNFISGMIILMQNEINIGDIIDVDGVKGTIVDIQVRATILQAFNGTKITIPNGTMLSTKIISYTSNPFRRIDFYIGIGFSSNIEQAKALALSVMNNHPGIEKSPLPDVLVTELLDSAVNLRLRYWVKSRGSGWLKIRSELIRDIKAAFDSQGIEIPFPIRTLHGTDENPLIFNKQSSI